MNDMAPWPIVLLGHAIRHRKAFITIDDFAEYKRCRVQLHAKGIVLRDIISGAGIQTKQQQVCRGGEFLVAEIDAKLGGFGIVPAELDGAIVSSHYFLYEIEESRLDRRFLDYYIRTRPFRDQVEAQGSTNYAAIRPQHVLGYTIPLPPLAEQQRIVARIDALAARIEEAKGLRAQAVAEVASAPSAVHLFYAENREVELGKVLDLFEDQVPVVSDRSYPQVGIRGFGEGLFDRETLSGHQTSYRYFNRLYPGAVVLSQVKGWEGAIAVCDAEFAGRFASPEYRTFRCREDYVLPEYLRAIVSTPWFLSKLASITRGIGARRQRVRPEKFLELRVEMPSVDLQKRALPMFDKLYAIKRLQTETQAELDALLPSVLDRAFRGEL